MVVFSDIMDGEEIADDGEHQWDPAQRKFGGIWADVGVGQVGDQSHEDEANIGSAPIGDAGLQSAVSVEENSCQGHDARNGSQGHSPDTVVDIEDSVSEGAVIGESDSIGRNVFGEVHSVPEKGEIGTCCEQQKE